MKNTLRALAFLAVLVLSSLALYAAPLPPGSTYYGCWSPYPNCVGAKHVYRDPNGGYWQCNACSATPSTANCYLSNIGHIGYWCNVTSES